jgi:hypothetical protein
VVNVARLRHAAIQEGVDHRQAVLVNAGTQLRRHVVDPVHPTAPTLVEFQGVIRHAGTSISVTLTLV